VSVVEANDQLGGGLRSSELTLPGFLHDEFAAVHPMALASPFFQAWKLSERVDFIVPETSYGHPLPGGAVYAHRDLEATVAGLGDNRGSGRTWRELFGPLIERIDDLAELTLGPLWRIPSDPGLAARLGYTTMNLAETFWRNTLKDPRAKALLAGVSAHAVGRMPSLAVVGAGTVLASHAHARGWGIPVGGSQQIADALVTDIIAHGGSIELGHNVTSIGELADARVVLLDVTPRALLRIAGDRLPAQYRRNLARFRHGDAAARVDYALDGPVPWTEPQLRNPAALHLGGTWNQIRNSEREVSRGKHPENPYVLLSQPTIHDSSRAPAGRHIVWAYTHVPAGSLRNPTETITAAIERLAPGFRDRILQSSGRSAMDLNSSNANLVGGDIAGGAVTLQQLVARPVASADPWRTPARGIYLCSASTSPGPGVHGMAGWHAARSALRNEFGLDDPLTSSNESQ
jgi:phytoene dehydrogenase-like protein